MSRRHIPWEKGWPEKTHSTVEGGKIRWVEKQPERVRSCHCGGRYIKTRRGQKTCVACILHGYPHQGVYKRKVRV